MKVLIVAKTRRGVGACVGGLSQDGKSVRLVAHDAATNEHAGLEYQVGEVWEIDQVPDPNIVPPHVENIIVLGARHLRCSDKVEESIYRFMPPVVGGPEKLFDGLAQTTTVGSLYLTERTGLPRRSTMFWQPDRPLQLDSEGKRIRYRYPSGNGGCSLTFVGFQEPLPEIPAGTVLRVSLAHPWRPKERPEDELRCFVQISGWFLNKDMVLASSPQKQDPGAVGLLPTNSLPSSRLFDRARDVLKQTFGFSQFLPVQREAIARILQRRDTLVIMPTGGGKSLCYQLPALLFEGLTVVISPLIALMQDQVRQLRELDVPAASLNHMVSLNEWRTITHAIRDRRIKILYLAPETLLRPEILLLLEQSHLACLAVDEAHCISEWGHDFRPEYRQIRDVRQRFSRAVCVLLTATATARVRQDIRRMFSLPAEGEFVASFNRQNLFLAVETRKDELARILEFLKSRRDESGIIYCGTRKHADELCAALNKKGWPTLPYHAGLEDDIRRQNQRRFIDGDIPLMVATVAFGMGINKSNVRFVIHAQLPKDLESYYQEIGRAGRDGLPSHCLLLYNRGDVMFHRHFIEEGAPSEREGRQDRLNAMLRFAEVRTCRRVPLLAYFGETSNEPCGNCDSCVAKPAPGEMIDVTNAARRFLSCVQATGQVFGPGHIIAVLRGSKAARVLARHHDRLPIYGGGTEHSTEEWLKLSDQLLHLAFLEREIEFGSLRLTLKGLAVLKGTQKVLVQTDHVPSPQPKGAARKHDPEPIARHRSDEIGELFVSGMSIDDISQRYGIKSGTVLVNLEQFLEEGGSVNPQRLLALSRLTNPERALVLATFDRLGFERLTPVYQALSKAFSYEDLHLLRLYRMARA